MTTPSHSLSFGYDPLGRRVSTTLDGSSTTFHVYDDLHVVAEYDGSGTRLREFAYGPRVDEVVSMLNAVTGTRYYDLSDGLESVSEVTGTNTAVVERYEYAPFGTTTVKNGSGQTIPETAIGNPWAFTGRRYDAKASLYDYRARHYAPTIGRFMQRDPLGYGDGPNLYAYVGNDPTNRVDPSGLSRSLGDCLTGCVLSHFGVLSLTAASGVSAIHIPKRLLKVPVAMGAKDFTNLISYLGFRLFPDARIGFKIFNTTRIFGIVGRLNPYLFAALTAYDAIAIGRCTRDCMRRDNPCN